MKINSNGFGIYVNVSGNRRQSFFLNHGQQPQGRATWFFDTALPIGKVSYFCGLLGDWEVMN